MIKKPVVRLGILLLASLMLAFLLEALQLWAQPPAYEAEKTLVQEAESLDLSAAELTNAEYDGECLKTKGEGSVILFRFSEPKPLSYLTIQSRKHIRNPFPIRVSLSRDGVTFAEEDSLTIETDPELVAWTADFQDGDWLALEISLDGKLTITSLDCRDAVMERARVPESIRFWRVGILTVLLFAGLYVLRWYHAFARLAAAARQPASWLKANRRYAGLRCLLFVLLSAMGYAVLRWLVSGQFFGEVNAPRQFFCLSGGAAAGLLLSCPEIIGAKPERFFAAFCLLAGCLMVFLFPNHGVVNWDGEYHYEQALRYSYLGEKRVTEADRGFLEAVDYREVSYPLESREALNAMQQEQYEEGAAPSEPPQIMLNSVYEIFAGTGLFLGRVLHLSWNAQLCLGRLFNLLAYTFFGYLAVRRLKSGKMILACILLIPTNVFVGSTFSYDPGVTVFLALALSYYFAEWQEPGAKLTRSRAYIMLGAGAFACLTKAFYAPALLLTLFMPRNKWAASKEESRVYITRRQYVLLLLCAVLAGLIPYILPLLQGTMTSDMRGGSSGEPLEHLAYVLENPLRWFSVMFRFQGEYFSPAQSRMLLTYFCYEGKAPYWEILYALLVVLAFTDRKPCDRPFEKKIGIRIIGMLLLYLITCIICLCLYVTFTDLGADTIRGVQPRYLSPIVFPVLMLAGSGLIAGLLKIDREWKQRVFNSLAFSVSLFVLFFGIWHTCVIKF